jgi:Ca-activated chloride channel family protein
MKKGQSKSILFIFCLIAATGAAMAYSANRQKAFHLGLISTPVINGVNSSGPLTISGKLTQNKILQGSDGRVNLALTLQVDDMIDPGIGNLRQVDIVVVLDRSGSMKGRKIHDARQAVLKLLTNLSPKDRFALVTYSDGVRQFSGLRHVTDDYRKQMEAVIQRIRSGGGTNLGAGLQTGIDILLLAAPNGNNGKVILISDGLANKGITDPQILGNIAGIAMEKEFAVSTVGVGTGFNELLMTRIADQGAGNYYYLENPSAFAEVFQKEFYVTRSTALTGVSVHVPIGNGISLHNASGYPVKLQNHHAVFHPGNLRSNQTRKLFLTLQISSDSIKAVHIGKIKVRYFHNGMPFEATLHKTFEIACVKDQKKVFSSIDKSAWADKVIQEDYNRLKQEVAGDIKAGKKDQALGRIKMYYREKEAINETIASKKVAENLDRDIKALEHRVKDTFQGAPSAVLQKQNSTAKALQYEGYRDRRQK